MHDIKNSIALLLLLASVYSGQGFSCHKCSSDVEPCTQVDDSTPVIDCSLQGKETNCYQLNYINPADESVHVDRGCWPGVHYCELIAAMTDFNIIHCNECKGDNCNSTPFAL